MEYELHWIMHNYDDVPDRLIPDCEHCHNKMTLDLDCAFHDDYEMSVIFEAELGSERAGELECEGYFSYAIEQCFCPSCDIDNDDAIVHYEDIDKIRWYYAGGPDYINGVLELPADQRKRLQLEKLKRQSDAGQQMLPGFPEPDFSILEPDEPITWDGDDKDQS